MMINKFINKIWRNKKMDDDWKNSSLNMIYKAIMTIRR